MPNDIADERHDVRPVTFADRLLAEAVRAAEDLGDVHDDTVANARARDVDGDFERKIIVRARSLSASKELTSALHHVRTVVTWLIVLAALFTLVAGAGAARTALGGERSTPVIVLPVLGGLLGVQSLLLLIWFAMWFVQPRRLSSASLGGLLLHGAQYVARLGTKSTTHLAAIQSYTSVSMHSTIARWKTSAISHGLWTAFNLGCIAMLLSLLSTRAYTFGWETTILPDDVYTPMIETIGWLPNQLGFNIPTAEQISASQWSDSALPPDDAKNAWSSFLIGSIVVYGTLPRLTLLVMSIIGVQLAQRRYRLDTSKPGYIRLRNSLMPISARTGIVDGDDHTTAMVEPPAILPDQRPQSTDGVIPIVGIEIEQPTTGWPPNMPNMAFTDLGRIDSRAQREQVVQKLRESATRPAALVVVCAVTTTPDRGVASELEQLHAAASAPIILALTAGHIMRQRDDHENHGDHARLENRLNDWRTMAQQIGIDEKRIIEIDLDHATDVSLSALANVLTDGAVDSLAHRHLEPAFELIEKQSATWNGPPSDAQQLTLHTEIARLYRQHAQSWMQQIHAAAGQSAKIVDQARESASRSMSLLPGKLRATPIWALAGATAGAIGCVAVATVLTPAALAALPGWTLVGGALTTIAHAARQLAQPEKNNTNSDSIEPEGFAEAVAAATLFALLLELQGTSEATISRVLDGALVNTEQLPSQPHQVAPWLDTVRHRFDLALVASTGGPS